MMGYSILCMFWAPKHSSRDFVPVCMLTLLESGLEDTTSDLSEWMTVLNTHVCVHVCVCRACVYSHAHLHA